MKEIKKIEELDDQLTLVDFYAVWCGPCRMLGPVLDEVAKVYSVAKVNIDESPELADQYGVHVVPTMILFKNKKVVAQREGYATEIDLLEWIKKHE